MRKRHGQCKLPLWAVITLSWFVVYYLEGDFAFQSWTFATLQEVEKFKFLKYLPQIMFKAFLANVSKVSISQHSKLGAG